MNKIQRKIANETKDAVSIYEEVSFRQLRILFRWKFKNSQHPHAMKQLCNNCMGNCHGRKPTRLAYCRYWD